MADSVDRVFVHALNTVKKIPKTGATRPPSADRMRLYGLYKQAMEGDVDGVMERPSALYSGLGADELRREQDKWDAWNAERGLSRTEAKRRYIETLIETMHTHATTPSAAELVAELEFVWNQIKDNTKGSNSNSNSPHSSSGSFTRPRHEHDREERYYDTRDRPYNNTRPQHEDLHKQQQQQQQPRGNRPRDRQQHDRQQHDSHHVRRRGHSPPGSFGAMAHRRPSLGAPASDGGPMKMLSPMSEEDEAEREARMRLIEEELEAAADEDGDDDLDDDGQDEAAHLDPRAVRWSRMMERAMVKLSAEIAALREQISSGREFRARRARKPMAWCGWLLWTLVKHAALDAFVLALVLLWMRRRKDRRLEDHVRGALRVVREYVGKMLPPR